MKISYLVVFGALSQMVKARGACDKLCLDIIIIIRF